MKIRLRTLVILALIGAAAAAAFVYAGVYNIAATEPIPRTSVRIAATVNTGVRFNDLSAYRSEVAMPDNTRMRRSSNGSGSRRHWHHGMERRVTARPNAD